MEEVLELGQLESKGTSKPGERRYNMLILLQEVEFGNLIKDLSSFLKHLSKLYSTDARQMRNEIICKQCVFVTLSSVF